MGKFDGMYDSLNDVYSELENIMGVFMRNCKWILLMWKKQIFYKV